MPTGVTEADLRLVERCTRVEHALARPWDPTPAEYMKAVLVTAPAMFLAAITLAVGLHKYAAGDIVFAVWCLFLYVMFTSIGAVSAAQMVSNSTRRRSDRLLGRLAEQAGINPNSV